MKSKETLVVHNLVLSQHASTPQPPQAWGKLQELVNEHRRWLESFSGDHQKSREGLLKSGPEAALCEAMFRRLFVSEGCEIIPNGQVNKRNRRPDF